MSIASDRAWPSAFVRSLARSPGIVEKKMFGGIGFMLNGNMAVGTTAKGELLVRIDPDKASDARSSAAARSRCAWGRARDDAASSPSTARYRHRCGRASRRWVVYALRLREDAARRNEAQRDHDPSRRARARRSSATIRASPRRYMFGGLTFLLNGHILVGCKKDGADPALGRQGERRSRRGPARRDARWCTTTAR